MVIIQKERSIAQLPSQRDEAKIKKKEACQECRRFSPAFQIKHFTLTPSPSCPSFPVRQLVRYRAKYLLFCTKYKARSKPDVLAFFPPIFLRSFWRSLVIVIITLRCSAVAWPPIVLAHETTFREFFPLFPQRLRATFSSLIRSGLSPQNTSRGERVRGETTFSPGPTQHETERSE